MEHIKKLLAALLLVGTLVLISACGGGGGGGGGTVSILIPIPDGPTRSGMFASDEGGFASPPPEPPTMDFVACSYIVDSMPNTECYGGAPGYKELREHVASLPDPIASSVTLVIDGGSDNVRQQEVFAVAALHNRDVGSPLVLTGYANGKEISDDIRAGIIDPDIISSSADRCIGKDSPFGVCFDETLFDEPGEPIVVLQASDFAFETALDDMLSSGVSSLFIETEVNKGHWLWVYGLNRDGDDIERRRSSRCHELIKDYCIGAPFYVADPATGTFDLTTGVFTATDIISRIRLVGGAPFVSRIGSTSFSAPIVAVALKLIKEADPTIANTRLIRIICETATDLGPAGNDATFGCGALNLFQLFDAAGDYIGSAAIPGINNSPTGPFSTVPVDANTGFVNNELLSNTGSTPGSPFSYSGKMWDSASICMGFLCTFYSSEDSSFQTGLAVSEEKGFASLLFERKDNDFFGGSSTEGSRSDFGDVDYLKGAVGYKAKFGLDEFVFRLDIAKGAAEATGGRIDNLEGTLTKFSIEANRALSARSNLSFYASAAKFRGEAGISGSKHNLQHDGMEFGVNFLHWF